MRIKNKESKFARFEQTKISKQMTMTCEWAQPFGTVMMIHVNIFGSHVLYWRKFIDSGFVCIYTNICDHSLYPNGSFSHKFPSNIARYKNHRTKWCIFTSIASSKKITMLRIRIDLLAWWVVFSFLFVYL